MLTSKLLKFEKFNTFKIPKYRKMTQNDLLWAPHLVPGPGKNYRLSPLSTDLFHKNPTDLHGFKIRAYVRLAEISAYWVELCK
jgi:hypothetical protein